MSNLYHVIVYCPEDAADAIRDVVAHAGAGKIGNYDSCSFSVKGTGRFRPLQGAHPAIGSIDNPEEVAEERIEFMVTKQHLKQTIENIIEAHPYEEPAIHVLQMLDYKTL